MPSDPPRNVAPTQTFIQQQPVTLQPQGQAHEMMQQVPTQRHMSISAPVPMSAPLGSVPVLLTQSKFIDPNAQYKQINAQVQLHSHGEMSSQPQGHGQMTAQMPVVQQFQQQPSLPTSAPVPHHMPPSSIPATQHQHMHTQIQPQSQGHMMIQPQSQMYPQVSQQQSMQQTQRISANTAVAPPPAAAPPPAPMEKEGNPFDF